MKIISIDLKRDCSASVNEVVSVLEKGGAIVYPTDTVYGLGANACDWHAVEQIFKIKNRPLTKPLPIIARNLKWVKELVFVPPKLEPVLEEIWPSPSLGSPKLGLDKSGAVTVILPKKDIVPDIVTAGKKNVGIRIPNYAFTDELLLKFGYPLTATSANISGDDSTGDINKIINSFKGKVWQPDLILDAGVLPPSLPSTILDLSTIKPKILRVGSANPDKLIKLLGM